MTIRLGATLGALPKRSAGMSCYSSRSMAALHLAMAPGAGIDGTLLQVDSCPTDPPPT